MGKRGQMDTNDILRKYAAKIESQIETEKGGVYSKEYRDFKEDSLPHLTRFERLCKNVGTSLKIKLNEKENIRIQRQLSIAHLDIAPSDVMAFASVMLILSIFASILVIAGFYLITDEFPLAVTFLMLMFSLFLFSYISNNPERIAQAWRLKASSQMVPCILYIVVYMRHTSNLERAIKFASEHLSAPLALDLKKIFWDVEVGKYSTIKESLDAYLETWRDYSIEFIESFHLIESSLYEPSETRRIQTLEKALDVVLDGIYEKMLHYAHDVKTPLTNLYMLGIVLPTLALALLPLASTLLGGSMRWYHVMILFNLLVPFFVFYLTNKVLSRRPGGYGETELLEQNPNYYLYESKSPYFISFLIAVPFFILGLLPLLFQYTPLTEWLGMEKEITLPVLGGIKLFDFKQTPAGIVGPFGVGALLLSLFIPFAIMLFFSIAYKLKTSELIKTRTETKQLEDEFASSLFQLGNRLGDGIPAEIAFSRVAESSKGTRTGEFFRIVNLNINQLGMSLETSIFNQRRGAIVYYPSELIKTSMQIMLESVKKGLQVAARALISISQYIKNIHKINERLRDLLAEIVADMRSNMTFLAPVLAGIVVGLSGMITAILNRLQTILAVQETGTEAVGLGTVSTLTQIFDITAMIPPYYLQLIIGVYVIQIIFILSSTLVTVESGIDTLEEKVQVARNLQTGVGLYFIISLIAVLTLSMLALVATGGIG